MESTARRSGCHKALMRRMKAPSTNMVSGVVLPETPLSRTSEAKAMPA